MGDFLLRGMRRYLGLKASIERKENFLLELHQVYTDANVKLLEYQSLRTNCLLEGMQGLKKAAEREDAFDYRRESISDAFNQKFIDALTEQGEDKQDTAQMDACNLLFREYYTYVKGRVERLVKDYHDYSSLVANGGLLVSLSGVILSVKWLM